ncbi:MAG: 50S ribosomal protein L23 [Bacteroidota bacterium]
MAKILHRPLITEKIVEAKDRRQYAFEVDQSANKIEIIKAIEMKFHVTVTSARTMNVKGKRRAQLTRRGRFEGRTAGWKKAIVTLKEGDKIEFFENV